MYFDGFATSGRLGMSKDKIIASALARFANQGYYHTSLAEIAEDVGIRKPSIYAHFSSKEAIFHSLLQEAFTREQAALALFATAHPSRQLLHQYFVDIPLRYEGNGYLRFWIRALYMPPYDLEKEIKDYDDKYSKMIDTTIDTVLRRIEDENGLLRPKIEVADAFTGLLRGIHAELLYKGPQEAIRKAGGMWAIFELVFSK